jgi:hypothetical protein
MCNSWIRLRRVATTQERLVSLGISSSFLLWDTSSNIGKHCTSKERYDVGILEHYKVDLKLEYKITVTSHKARYLIQCSSCRIIPSFNAIVRGTSVYCIILRLGINCWIYALPNDLSESEAATESTAGVSKALRMGQRWPQESFYPARESATST